MLVSDFAGGLEFNDYLVVADKVGEIFLVENSTSIFQRQSGLRDCGNPAMLEFNSETFLVNRFVEPAAFILVNFEASTNDRVALILEDQVGNGIIWRYLACLADHRSTFAIQR